MGLACSQIRLLTLTSRKADCETDIAINSMRKMALSREMSELSAEYNAKLKASQVCYFEGGTYNKVNYNYLMGNPAIAIKFYDGKDLPSLKCDNSIVLTDYKGQVVLSDEYANMLIKAGVSVDSCGRGSTFSPDLIPKILADMIYSPESEEDFKKIINDDELGNSTSFDYTSEQYISGEAGESGTMDSSASTLNALKNLVDFYYPILIAASTNGWTTEYNRAMNDNPDYISDALISNVLRLETINNAGEYDEGSTLTYFTSCKGMDVRTTAEKRQEVTAWYDAEKAIISDEETMLDINIQNLSQELEAIKTEIQSVKSLIDDAISTVFDWGSD